MCVTLPSYDVVPGQVINVRAYVYRPLASGGSVTALVVWDSPPNSIVDVYTITVSRDGQEIQDVSYTCTFSVH